ncbi:hypothetical protein AAMO2058_000753700 [Amorphochlora amoebiformis]
MRYSTLFVIFGVLRAYGLSESALTIKGSLKTSELSSTGSLTVDSSSNGQTVTAKTFVSTSSLTSGGLHVEKGKVLERLSVERIQGLLSGQIKLLGTLEVTGSVTSATPASLLEESSGTRNDFSLITHLNAQNLERRLTHSFEGLPRHHHIRVKAQVRYMPAISGGHAVAMLDGRHVWLAPLSTSPAKFPQNLAIDVTVPHVAPRALFEIKSEVENSEESPQNKTRPLGRGSSSNFPILVANDVQVFVK